MLCLSDKLYTSIDKYKLKIDKIGYTKVFIKMTYF